MFKVGDKVKYTFDSRQVIYGVIEDICDVYNCHYPYYVHYGDGEHLYDFYDWESDETIELVEEGASVNDAKFRAFLEEVANVDYVGYSEEYRALEKVMRGYNDEIKEAIEALCNFYKDFTPNNRKKMTVEEIEKELGYKIEVVE